MFFLVLSVGGRILDPDAQGWARALSAVALLVLIAAIVVLLSHRSSLVPDGGQAVRPTSRDRPALTILDHIHNEEKPCAGA
ncbi:hypothetical protein [Actinocorallia aurantiaca]|uniref:Uncharacterized protein n=1 Tax=Actinocorallia aurantiaca TaxID=46204 RepID=A0ABN3U612_9ACTN